MGRDVACRIKKKICISAVTKFANTNKSELKWQSQFDDHILGNQDELNRIALYLENNVALGSQINITMEMKIVINI